MNDKSVLTNQWIPVRHLPQLEDNEVHLWRIDLTDFASHLPQFASLLTPIDQVEAGRKIGQARDHFTIGRACVRLLIGNALEIDPRELTLIKGAHGKPEILPVAGRNVFFNLAHSKNTLLIALRRHGALGVDVEYLDRSIDVMEVAQANFTKQESNTLAAIADPRTRYITFYRYWTRKESIGKADGRGLLLPLASFDVSFESMHAHPVHLNESPDQDPKLYLVSDLDLGDMATGALALESSPSRIRQLDFSLFSAIYLNNLR